MGGNGPQHTLVMRGAIGAKRSSRASLEAHHSQARRSVAHVHCACDFFSSTAAAVEERLNAVTDRRAVTYTVVAMIYPQSSVHALRCSRRASQCPRH